MYYLGVDLGADALASVVNDEKMQPLFWHQEKVSGDVLGALKRCAEFFISHIGDNAAGLFVTGSGARLAAAVLGADGIIAAEKGAEEYLKVFYPDIQSLVKLGYEENLVLHLYKPPKRRGKKNDCIRNLGAFWQQQLERYRLSVSEWDQLQGEPLHISAKCNNFMLRDMLRLEQQGFARKDIASGVNEALVRCFLQNTAKDDVFEGKILLTGIMAQSRAIAEVLASETNTDVVTDEKGAFLFAQSAAYQASLAKIDKPKWRGRAVLDDEYRHEAARCEDGCENKCALTKFFVGETLAAIWGGKCDRWNDVAKL